MKLFSKFVIHCALLATSLLLVGCEKSDVRYSETLDRNALMALPFPGWTPTGNDKIQPVDLLEEGHFAVTAQWGRCWQGYGGRWLGVVGFQGDLATLLNPGIALSVDNDGARGACSALDNPVPAKEDAEDGSGECLDIQSKWKFQGNRLLVSYEGRLSRLAENGELLPTKKIRERTIYVATPGELTLISGSDPIPAF